MMTRSKLAESVLAALVASLSLQAGAVAVLFGHGLTGLLFASLGSTILIGRLRAAGMLSSEKLLTFATAVLILAFAAELFTLYIRSRLGGSGFAALYTPEDAPAAGSGKYRGVILWQEEKPHPVLVPPRAEPGRGVHQSKQPLSIPFDGVYWFFKFPDRQPPKDSYTVRGNPSAIAFRSSDVVPLQMEARQNFVAPIDLSCCVRIAVEILNADRYPGTLSIDLILTNLSLPGQPSESLGVMPVTSMPQWVSGDEFQPAPEVLSFAIPATPRISQFDAATVRFIRTGKRGVSSAKIAIERFTLVPRGR
jgi:hypothetical protein